jgi:hypothetical protein
MICAPLSVARMVWLSSYAICAEAELIEPAAIVADARPLITWRAIEGASRYRVEIESRVPEGRVLVSLDTQVSGTSFQPPRPLTDFRSAVKVRVTAGCPTDDGSRLREKPASFHIDTSPLCPAPARIAASDDRQYLEWSAVARAIRYDVTLLSTDGVVRWQGQTQQTRFPIANSVGTLVAVVRGYCATGFGPGGSALIATPKP